MTGGDDEKHPRGKLWHEQREAGHDELDDRIDRIILEVFQLDRLARWKQIDDALRRYGGPSSGFDPADLAALDDPAVQAMLRDPVMLERLRRHEEAGALKRTRRGGKRDASG
jgi:hypothetical protein